MKSIYTLNALGCGEIHLKGDWWFPAMKVGVWAIESRGFLA